MRVIRVLVTLAAVWGALITILLASGRYGALPAGLRGAEREPGHAPESAPNRAASSPEAPVAAKRAPEAAPEAVPAADVAHRAIVAAHYAVCAREEGAPACSRIELGKGAPALFAFHCGPSAHLIAVALQSSLLVPERVLALRASSHSPAEAAHAGAIFGADVDGDGQTDLLVPSLLVDRGGAPSGGALYLLRRRADGSFDGPRRVLELAPGGGVAATLDAQPGSDLALLHLHDARAARASELWLVRGGPAPLRSEKLDAGVGPSALAAADLDQDGIDDIAVVSEREGRLRLFMSRGARPGAREPRVVDLPGVREAVSGDIDGDGHRDLVLSGERVWLLRAQKEGDPEPMPIADSALLRDVQLIDIDGDGKLDVVGYAHPSVVVLQQTGALAFVRKTFATLRGDMGVLFARLAYLDDDPRAELVLSLVSAGPDAQIEFGLAQNLDPGSDVQLAPSALTLRDTPLPQSFALP